MIWCAGRGWISLGGSLGQLHVWGSVPSVTIFLQPRAITPRGGEADPTECQPRDQGLFKTNAHSWAGASLCEDPLGHVLRASVVSGSSPGPELGALPVLAQIPVSEPEARQCLTQLVQCLGRGFIQA